MHPVTPLSPSSSRHSPTRFLFLYKTSPFCSCPPYFFKHSCIKKKFPIYQNFHTRLPPRINHYFSHRFEACVGTVLSVGRTQKKGVEGGGRLSIFFLYKMFCWCVKFLFVKRLFYRQNLLK